MGNLKDEANAYNPKSSVMNISELSVVAVDLAVLEETEAEFPYKYIEVAEQRYKVPASVLANLKAILAANPNMKTFKVSKTGKGMDTRYVVIPLS